MGTYSQEMANHSIYMGSLVREREAVEARIQTAVQDARDMGMSWGMVALGLGSTRQAVWERYGLSPFEKSERRRLDKQPGRGEDPRLPLEGGTLADGKPVPF